jgi:tight adherence protein B
MGLYLAILAVVLLWAFPWGMSNAKLMLSSQVGRQSGSPEQLIEGFVAEIKAGATLQKTFSDQLDLSADALDYLHILNKLTRRWPKESKSLMGLLAHCLSVSYRLSSQLGTNTVSLFRTILQRIELYRSSEFTKIRAVAGPKMSARLLAALPLFGVGMGFLFGQNLFAIYFDLGTGTIIFLIGIGLWVLGRVSTIRTINKSFPQNSLNSSFDLIFVLQATNVCLQAGFSVIRSLDAVGRCLNCPEGEALVRTAANLKRGLDWNEAWDRQFLNLAPWTDILEPSFRYGRAIGDQIDTFIQRYCSQMESEIIQKGEKLAVKTLIPLGLCYLPSFIILGLIPLMIALTHFG